LITGASSGIGKATAVEFANKDVTLILVGRNKSQLENTALKCTDKKANVVIRILDVTNKDEMKKCIRELDAKYKLDLIIANAGVASNTLKEIHYTESSYELFNVNVMGVLNTILPIIPCFQERKRGHIAIVGSLAGFSKNEINGAYTATKSALRYLSDDLRPQLKYWNIDCTLISPGYVNSGMTPASMNADNIGFMMEDEAAKIIRKGLQNNDEYINFPLKVFTMAYLFGTLHPMLQSLYLKKTTTRNESARWIGQKFEVDPDDPFGGEC